MVLAHGGTARSERYRGPVRLILRPAHNGKAPPTDTWVALCCDGAFPAPGVFHRAIAYASDPRCDAPSSLDAGSEAGGNRPFVQCHPHRGRCVAPPLAKCVYPGASNPICPPGPLCDTMSRVFSAKPFDRRSRSAPNRKAGSHTDVLVHLPAEGCESIPETDHGKLAREEVQPTRQEGY